MILKTIIFSCFFVANAFASASNPAIAVLDLSPNFEFGQVGKEFRVHYSSFEQGSESTSKTTIKIYETGQTSVFHTFDVEKPNESKVYYFALENAVAGSYDVQVCNHDAEGTETCSERNPALKKMQSTQHEITCKQGKTDASGNWIDDAEELRIPMISPENKTETWLTRANIDQIEATFRSAKLKSDWIKHGVQKNPSYIRQKGLFYASVYFNIYHFKQMFETEKKMQSETERLRFTHEFCERKYLLTANAHLVNVKTKEVKHRFKTTLFLSEGGKNYFLFDTKAGKDRQVHVEMAHENADIAAGSYYLYITFCATEKDAVESTFCSDAISKVMEVEDANSN